MIPRSTMGWVSNMAGWSANSAWLAAASLVVAFVNARASAADLADTLFSRGVGPIGEQYFSLPQPLLIGVEERERNARLSKLTKRITWERFSQKSVFAPVIIEIDPLENAKGERVAHSVYSAFILYTPLSKLKDRQLLTQLFGDPSASPDEGVGQEVPQEVIEARAGPVDSEDTHFISVTLPLMNRVEVQGVLRVESAQGADWLQVVWEFDPRFDADPQYRNRWYPLEPDELGRLKRGAPHPYQGCAGYMTVQQLDAEQNQLFVETRMIMHEPQAWFNGSNFLRAKLPLTLQENARSLRRKLQP